MNLWLVFLTGLTSGGVTCAAMQGGLLASVIANHKKTTIEAGFGVDDVLPVGAFLISKFTSHLLIGFLLGWLGNSVEISLPLRLFFQGFAAMFMIATAFNLLDLHPIFRYMAIRPPKWAYRLIKKNENSASLFAPSLLGFLTVLIPCGVTQAMAVLSITSSSPVMGALIMGVFVLGTVPVFGLIGVATSRLSEVWKHDFMQIAAILLIIMSISSFNGILQVNDSPYSLQRLGPQLVRLLPPYDKSSSNSGQDPSVSIENGVQKVTISISSGGYTPKYFRVKSGIPVELTLDTDGEVYSCATAFTFKAFDIYEVLKPVDTKVHKFTPEKKGKFTFSCSMGMYSGVMEVI